MKPSFKISAISLAVLGSFSFVSNANAGNTDYSNQTTAGVISVIGAGNSISGDNLKVDSAGYQSNSQRNEGVYIGDGSSASFGGDYFEVKFKETDSTHEFAGVQVNTQGQDTTAIFNSTSTVIDVEGPGASLKWGFGLLVNGINGKASAKFTGGDVLIRATTENYTSQTLTVKENSEIINELLVGLQFFSELDIARVNESLKTFVANLKWDGSFIMKLINIPFYKMDKASFTIKKEMLKEIQVTFEKYQDIPQEQMRLEVYD